MKKGINKANSRRSAALAAALAALLVLCGGLALGPTASGGATGLEATRDSSAIQTGTTEAVLGRLGSRLGLDLIPRKLTSRFSSLGSFTWDYSELVMALNDTVSTRALPFTNRYPVWDSVTQTQTMTAQNFDCGSGASPFQVSVKFRAPFYPRDEKVSSAPFIYIDVTARNAGTAPGYGTFFLARPHKLDFATSEVKPFSTATEAGFTYKNKYDYDESAVNPPGGTTAYEALALPAGETSDVSFRGSAAGEFANFSSNSLWEFPSPSGYPRSTGSTVNAFNPTGYTGAAWTIWGLAPGASSTKHFVLAGYVPDYILNVSNSNYSDSTFRFRYTRLFPGTVENGVISVVNYAVTSRWTGDNIEEKSSFFDNAVGSDAFLSMDAAYSEYVRGLMALSFQNYVINTWWAKSDYNRDWFSVWEGDCKYHSTVDVEYNQAWFYFEFWPDLLRQIIDEWTGYINHVQQGYYLSHDMGQYDSATGQAYPHDMACEENADFVLLLYKYWKSTGDAGFVKQHMNTVRNFIDFLIACDTNNNGLPDIYTQNTVDQGSPAIQSARDQTYLGVKCLGAFEAAREMSTGIPGAGDSGLADRCRGMASLINQTLEYDLWLTDHYAVCLDGAVNAGDRDAYSIYANNGLLYLLGVNPAPALTSTNTANMRTDLVNSARETLKEYGCTHSSFDSYNEWVSQNAWRDMAACHWDLSLPDGNPLAFSKRYWNLEQYFSANLSGGFWDVVVYPGGTAGGDSGRADGSGPFSSPTSDGIQQSLGYYPRGLTSLGYIGAVAGVVLDVPGNRLYYKPTTAPLKVPVFNRADWSNPNPGLRVPVLYFSNLSGSPTVTNGYLLPPTAPLRVEDLTGLSGGQHPISPNGDGTSDNAAITFDLPTDSSVSGTIWDGSRKIREYQLGDCGAGHNGFSWDGKTESGEVVSDGLYTARIDASPKDSGRQLRPASTPVWVNNSIPDLSDNWYLAEGFTGKNATGGEFEEYVLIQNPGEEAATVDATFMLPGGATVQRSYQVSPGSRFTISVDSVLPDAEVSTSLHSDRKIAVERAMYFNGRKAGHDTIGVTRPSRKWYLAEGYTAQDFDEYVLVQNPGDTESRITAKFMTPDNKNETRTYAVGPHSRFTIHVDEIIPENEVSIEIESTEPVVVERAQYLNSMKSGTGTIAACSTSRNWFLAEGYTDQGFEDWVLIQNPGAAYNNVVVTFMEKGGTNTVKNYTLSPASRFTINVNELLPAKEVSVKVSAAEPVLVERAMYWNNRSDGHACIGTPSPDIEWYLPEGYSEGGFETWVLVQNPNDSSVTATFVFMEPSGTNTVRQYSIAPRSRYTVGVNAILPSAEMSTKVIADAPIIVERAVYFNGRSGGTDSLGVRGYR